MAGKKGCFNYMRTVADIHCNKLFVLDYFGYEHRGSYYLGENGDYFIPEIVIELINTIKKRLD